MEALNKWRKLGLGIVCLFYIESYGQSFQTISNTGLPNLGNSASQWADFNNDGLLDIALIGTDNNSIKIGAVFKNNGNNTFTNLGAGIVGVDHGCLAVGDIDNDGFVDFFLSGIDNTNNKIARVYKNSGNGTFSNLSLTLESVGHGAAVFADINNDGWTDLIYTGNNSNGISVTKVYKNNKNNSFSEVSTALEAVSKGAILAADFNNDGFVDIVLAGLNINNRRTSGLYLNDKMGLFFKTNYDVPKLKDGQFSFADFNTDGFMDLVVSGQSSTPNDTCFTLANNSGLALTEPIPLPSISSSSIASGDFNNDGYPDILGSGFHDPEYKSFFHKNNNGTDFSPTGVVFTSITNGNVNLIDYNNDKKLDAFLTGYSVTGPSTTLYKNPIAIENTNPTTPGSFKAFVLEDSVTFNWNRSSDAETTAKGLTYNIYLGTSSKKGDLLNPLADITTGFRKVAGFGSIADTFAILKNLPEGKYFAGVQAVDAASAGSSFSAPLSFYVCYKVSLGEDKVVCKNEYVSLKVNTPKPGDVVRWFSSLSPSTPFATGDSIRMSVEENINVWAELTRQIGCVLYDTININLNPVSTVDAGIEKSVCIGSSIEIGGNPTARGSLLEYSFTWYPSDGLNSTNTANPVARPLRTTTYAVIVKTGDCVIDTAYTTVVVNPLPVVYAGDDITIGYGETAPLIASGGIIYLWTPAEGLSANDISNPVASPFQTTDYIVSVTDVNGCMNSDTVKVFVKNELFVPNLFTPNNDGKHDNLTIHGTGIKELSFKIYNKGGLLLYSTEDPVEAKETGWDGRYSGMLQNSGTYYWKIVGKFYDGTDLKYNGKNGGTINLIR